METFKEQNLKTSKTYPSQLGAIEPRNVYPRQWWNIIFVEERST